MEKLLAPDTHLVESALALYRQRFDAVGKFENRIYPEISEILDNLSSRGLTLFVATSKPARYAVDIIAHFNITGYFKKIYGSELDGDRTDKGALIFHILREEMIAADKTLMVGDRSYDMLGAGKHGVHRLGVTYGYGTAKELMGAGAEYLADSPGEMMKRIKALAGEKG